MNTTCVIIATWNNENQLKACLQSIRAYTRDCPYRICVVNNGNPLAAQMPQGDWTLLQNKENLGFIKATNQGLRQLNPNEHALLLNDDTQIVDPYWLSRMVTTLESETNIGAVGAVSNYVMGIQGVQYSHVMPLQHDSKYLIGYCLLLKNTAIQDVGLLDERFGMGMQDDLDYSLRLTDAGYRMVVDRSVFVIHYGSQSVNRLPEPAAVQEMKTRALLINKWGQARIDELFEPVEVRG